MTKSGSGSSIKEQPLKKMNNIAEENEIIPESVNESGRSSFRNMRSEVQTIMQSPVIICKKPITTETSSVGITLQIPGATEQTNETKAQRVKIDMSRCRKRKLLSEKVQN